MKKIVLFLFALILNFSFVHASGTWNLQGTTYSVDTMFHAKVGPGTTQTSLKLLSTANVQQRLFYVTVDLTNENIDLQTVLSKDKVVEGNTTVQTQATSQSKPGNVCFAAVNADFFAGNVPIGANVIHGEVYNTPSSDSWQQFGFDSNKTPYLGQASIKGNVSSTKGNIALNAVNMVRSDSKMTLYTHRYNNALVTGGGVNSTEIALIPANDGNLTLGATCKMKVTGASSVGGGMKIPTNGYVLSGVGEAATYIASLADGDIVDVTTTVAFNGTGVNNVEQMIGGQPMIVSNGIVLNTEGAIDHLVALNPRTAIGYSADMKHLVLLVVDGRSTVAAGVTSKVLADMMINLGCSEAMNFDGGGSSTLYVKELGVRNVPSDGTERSVCNSLCVVSKHPEDLKLDHIGFVDYKIKLPLYANYKPQYYGYNAYGDLIDTNISTNIMPQASNDVIEVLSDGTISAKALGNSVLEINYNGKKAVVNVSVEAPEELSIPYTTLILDTYKNIPIDILSVLNGNKYNIDPASVTWKSNDTSIATVNNKGVATGIADGETQITGTLNGLEFNLAVKVEKPTAHVMPIDKDMDISTWKITSTGTSNLVATPFENGMNLTYVGASGRNPNMKFAKSQNIWSLPDHIRIRVNPGDAKITALRLALISGSSSAKIIDVATDLKQNEMNELVYDIKDLCDVNDMSNYPIRLEYIYFAMGASTSGNNYVISMPGIEAIYDAIPAGVDNVIKDTKAINIYPNPVTSGEIINIALPNQGKWKINVFNEKGQLVYNTIKEVTDSSMQLSTVGFAQGQYLLHFNNGNNNVTSKLLVK